MNIDRKQNTFKLRLLFAAVSVLLICCLLCSCGMESCIASVPVFQSLYAPELVLVGEEPYQLPALENSLNSEDASERLREYFGSYIAVLESANTGGTLLSMEYSLIESDDGYLLRSAIECRNGGRVALPDIAISYAGALELPAAKDYSFFSDGELADSFFALLDSGYISDEELQDIDRAITSSEMYTLMVDYYEYMAKRPIDTSAFVGSVDFSELAKQSIALGLCDSEYSVDDRELPSFIGFVDGVAGLASALLGDVGGCGGRNAGEPALYYLCDLFLSLYSFEPAAHGQLSMVRGDIADLLEQSGEVSFEAAEDGKRLNRNLAAADLVSLYEPSFGTIYDYESYTEYIKDASDPFAKKALSQGLMSTFPSSSMFGGFYELTYSSLPEIAAVFANACYMRCMEEADSYAAPTYRDAIIALGKLDRMLEISQVSSEPLVVVNNSRDYDWYFCQYETGDYSYVNCMPTITTMACKWYDADTAATVEAMREHFLPEYDGGWYMWQVVECLSDYEVPNINADLTEDMLGFLDEGKIILTQMTESADDESGHCFIIYGYEKKGDTVRYYINDPGVYEGLDIYGKYPGKDMVLDKSYCDWIINRIAFYYVVVG